VLKFKLWLESWFPLSHGDKIHTADNPPQLTSNGDYILYHGTNMANARKIFKSRKLIRDDIGSIGISTTPSRADVFGAMKAKKGNPSVVLRIIVDKEWLDSQEISREVGGSGRDQFLIRTDVMPSEAIKDIQLARVSGTPLRGGSLEYKEDTGEVPIQNQGNKDWYNNSTECRPDSLPRSKYVASPGCALDLKLKKRRRKYF